MSREARPINSLLLLVWIFACGIVWFTCESAFAALSSPKVLVGLLAFPSHEARAASSRHEYRHRNPPHRSVPSWVVQTPGSGLCGFSGARPASPSLPCHAIREFPKPSLRSRSGGRGILPCVRMEKISGQDSSPATAGSERHNCAKRLLTAR